MEPEAGTEDDKFSQICCQLRMHPSAAPGWRMMFVKPEHGILTYFGSMSLALIIFAALFHGGFPQPKLNMLLPQAVLTASMVACGAGMYRFGPLFALSRMGQTTGALIVLSISAMAAQCFLGPPQYVPFNSKAITSVLLLLAIFLVCLSAQAGGTEAKHPAEPHASLKLPLFRAASEAIRGTNTISDFAIARSMFLKAEAPCFWFGLPSSCSKYLVMASVTTSLAATSLGCLALVTNLRSDFKDSYRGRRFVLGACVLQLVCDIGVLTATLLKLYSDTANARRVGANVDEIEKLAQDIAFAYVSCALSFMSFAVSSVGVRKVYQGLKQAMRRSSAAMRTGLARIAVAPVQRSAACVHTQEIEDDMLKPSALEQRSICKTDLEDSGPCRHHIPGDPPLPAATTVQSHSV